MEIRAWLIALGVFLCVAATDARADAKDEARLHNARAVAAYALGNYPEAATEYEAAFAQVPLPALLYNAAQSHRLAGHEERALLLYQSYIRVFGDEIGNRVEVEGHIANLKLALDSKSKATAAPPLGPVVSTPSPPVSASPAVEPLPPAPPLPSLSPLSPVVPVVHRQASPSPHRTRLWIGLLVGAVALVAAAITVGVLVGGSERDPSPTLGGFAWGR